MEAPENQKEILDLFKQGPSILENVLDGLTDNDLDYIPTNGGWTIRQIVHHLADGDDLWKIGIKMALGNNNAEYSLKWYAALPQTEWADRWAYEKRSISLSINLLKACREHIIQLLESADDGWHKSVQFKNNNDEVEAVPVGFIIQMQAEHVVHHVKKIKAILDQIPGNNIHWD